MGPNTNQEEHCVKTLTSEGSDVSLSDEWIIIYWSLREISLTQSSSQQMNDIYICRYPEEHFSWFKSTITS